MNSRAPLLPPPLLQEANRAFAAAVGEVYVNGDVIWTHDYHLLLLPAMLKERFPKTKIGWFLHTPFPSSEVYRTLPLREEILRCGRGGGAGGEGARGISTPQDCARQIAPA